MHTCTFNLWSCAQSVVECISKAAHYKNVIGSATGEVAYNMFTSSMGYDWPT